MSLFHFILPQLFFGDPGVHPATALVAQAGSCGRSGEVTKMNDAGVAAELVDAHSLP